MKQENKTAMVNGQLYDTVTGLPVAQDTPKKTAPTTRTETETPAGQLHTATQPSATLRRTATQKPVATKPQPAAHTVQPKKRPSRPISMDIARSPQVRKFTAPVEKKTEPAPAQDLAPRSHPHQLRANQRMTQKKQAASQPQQRSSKEIKEAEITKALNAQPAPEKKQKTKKKASQNTRLTRVGIVATVALAALLIAVWINLPALWINFASMRSNVDASYPQFTPDGYSIQLPIEAQDNRVRITFSSNQNNTSYSLSQEKSQWDSQAVRAMVEERSEGKFLTTNDRGLTIYTFGGDAAWVNGGVLYSLSGDAPLSNDTITRIANSL